MFKKNVIFILIFALVILSVGIFNYIVDPYEIFKTNKYKNNFDEPRELIYAYMKAYKDYRNKILSIGSSENASLWGTIDIYSEYLFVLTLRNGSPEQRYEILKNYLNLHPEIEHVHFIVSYVDLFLEENVPIPTYSNHTSLKEIYDILISGKALSSSIQKIKKDIIASQKETSEEEECYFKFQPKRVEFSPSTPENLDKYFNNLSFYTKKTCDLLKEKNIKYDFIIPPYNVSYMFLIWEDKLHYEYVERYKKFLTENSDVVYDFAFVNKYTSQNMFKNNFLFIDMKHASPIFGIKVFKYFFDPDIAEKDICFVLNKSNVDKKLEEENKLLEDYVKNNKDIVDYYNELEKRRSVEFFVDEYKNCCKDMPESEKKEEEYISQLNERRQQLN